MSYTPTTWRTGDVITAEKLNHAEIGVSTLSTPCEIYSFTATYNESSSQYRLSATWQEIYNKAIQENCILHYYFSDGNTNYSSTECYVYQSEYSYEIFIVPPINHLSLYRSTYPGAIEYMCISSDEYPELYTGD